MPKPKSSAKVRHAPARQDAVALLERDHETARELLEGLDETTERGVKQRTELRAKIIEEVRIHADIEESIFYPAYREEARKREDSKLYFEAAEEHALVHLVLAELEAADPTTQTFSAKAKVLKDLIEHHAEEEESEMLPRARKLLGKERLLELGDAMRARKLELQATKAVELQPQGRPARAGVRSSDEPRPTAAMTRAD